MYSQTQLYAEWKTRMALKCQFSHDCFFYIMKAQPSNVGSLRGWIGSTLAFLADDQLLIRRSAVRIPNTPHLFHVFESFQGLLPFVVLDSFIKHLNSLQWVSFQKTHLLLLFCQTLPLKSYVSLFDIFQLNSTKFSGDFNVKLFESIFSWVKLFLPTKNVWLWRRNLQVFRL